MILRSLRSRLMLGAVLWTFGLLTAAAFASLHGLLRYEQLHRIVFEAFFHNMLVFSGVALVALVAGFLQFRSGLSAVDRLRVRLQEVRQGHERRVEGAYPTEVQPLVDDLNTLLDHRERTVARALAKAGDLAHGLKTPLAILAHEAEQAKAAGHHELAEAIDLQVERMRRQMDYHLAHARAAASGATPGARCSVAESAEGLARALHQLHTARGIAIEVRVPADHTIRGQREDLDEMLGNLLDNACKWTRTCVVVTSAVDGDHIAITVDDDGPGLELAAREVVLQRGVRLDESEPGSGFGLAIVRELAELYNGSISLTDAPIGGVRATLRLPM